MTTREDVRNLASTLRRLVDLSRRDYNALWASLAGRDPVLVRNALIEALNEQAKASGQVAAAYAADWYEAVRAKSGAPGSWAAITADTVSPNIIEERVREAMRHYFNGNPEQTHTALGYSLDGWVKEPARETIWRNGDADKKWDKRYARIPTGAETCQWCLMLASRGMVYLSAASAGEGRKFHPDCDCQIVPLARGGPLPAGYDPDALYEQYLQRRAAR